MIKYFYSILILLVFQTHFAQTKENFFEQTNEFLKNQVSVDGKINYSKLKKSPGELLYILSNTSNLKIDDENNETQIAFWINAYNLLVIKNILENYPIKSVNFITDFFEKKFEIAGKSISLDEIELLTKNLINDPAKHFILSNGSNGGPKLLNKAYMPDSVMYNISYILKTTINTTGYIRIVNKRDYIEFPTVFEKFKQDFVTQYFNQIDFLNVFLENKLNNKLKISYYSYDWSLNELN